MFQDLSEFWQLKKGMFAIVLEKALNIFHIIQFFVNDFDTFHYFINNFP